MDEKFVPCAIYGRSSDDETMSKDHNSTEQQGYICEMLAKAQSLKNGKEYRICHKLIEQKAMSGATSNRPKYKELIKLIKKNQIKAIFTKELSRLSRNLMDFCELLELCEKHKVNIYMRGLEYEHDNPIGTMIVKLFAVIAEFERKINIERTKSSIRSRVKNNSIIHGGRVSLGFDKVDGKTGVWKVNKKELRKVITLMELFLEQNSYADTCREAKKLGIKTKTGREFTKDSLKRVLTNKKYIGKLKVPCDGEEEEYVDLPTGIVVPEDLFHRVQQQVVAIENGDRYKNRKGTRRVYPLSGILKHEDGSHYTGELGGKGKVYYYNRKNKKRVDAVALEDAVIESFKVFENETSMSAIVRELVSKKNERLEIVDSEIINVQKEIEELNGEIQGYIKSVAQIGSDEKFKEIVEEISLNIGKSKKEQSELNEKLVAMQLKRDNIRSESLECRPLKEIMKVVFKKLKASSNEMKKNILKNLCSEIKILSGNQVEIKWMPEVCGLGGQFVDLREKWGD